MDSTTVKPAWDWEAWQADAVVQHEARQAEREAEKAERLARGEETYAEYIGRLAQSPTVQAVVAAAPPITREQVEVIRRVMAPNLNRNPLPPEQPKPPRRSGRSLDPAAGTLYGTHLRATDGRCAKCGADGRREVDHCHEHLVVRGPICRGCNALDEGNMGEAYRKNCGWCAWDIWLANELA